MTVFQLLQYPFRDRKKDLLCRALLLSGVPSQKAHEMVEEINSLPTGVEQNLECLAGKNENLRCLCICYVNEDDELKQTNCLMPFESLEELDMKLTVAGF